MSGLSTLQQERKAEMTYYEAKRAEGERVLATMTSRDDRIHQLKKLNAMSASGAWSRFYPG